MHDLPARCPPRNRARISISQGSIRSFSAASSVQQRHCWRRSVRGLINAISLTSPWSFRTPSCRKRSSRREIACRFGHRGHTARLAGLLTPNPHRPPDTTKLSCLCRVRFGGVNWIPADNPRLSPTGNFEVSTRPERSSNSHRLTRHRQDRLVVSGGRCGLCITGVERCRRIANTQWATRRDGTEQLSRGRSGRSIFGSGQRAVENICMSLAHDKDDCKRP